MCVRARSAPKNLTYNHNASKKWRVRTFQLCTFSLKKRYGHFKNAHLPKKMPTPPPPDTVIWPSPELRQTTPTLVRCYFRFWTISFSFGFVYHSAYSPGFCLNFVFFARNFSKAKKQRKKKTKKAKIQFHFLGKK